jgi:hypothetical protein
VLALVRSVPLSFSTCFALAASARRDGGPFVRQYLFELQDATEALWHRLYNLAYESGRSVMTDDYLEETTVYALGRVLAADRVLTLEGMYPEVAEFYRELGKTLQGRRLSVAFALPDFQQYDRIALGEAVLEREEGRFRTITYLAFASRYGGEAGGTARWLEKAKKAVRKLADRSLADPLLDLLGEIAEATANVTGIPTSIAEKQAKRHPHQQAIS